MRTRNQSKQLESTDEKTGGKRKAGHVSESIDDSEKLSNISRQAVGKLLKRVKRGFDREEVGYLRRCDSETKLETESTGNEENSMDTAEPESRGGDAIQYASPKVETEGGGSHHSNPRTDDDGNDSDWEDGSIPILSPMKDHPENLINGVSVEFDISPGSAKRKPVHRATAEEKEVAEFVHKAHLLCLLGRGRLIDSACNDPLIQASVLSLLPSHLLKITDSSKLTVSQLSPLVNWFHNNFRVRIPSIAEKYCHLLLASTLETREGTPEMVAALLVALFRALNLTSRFVSVLDAVSLKPDAGNSESTLDLVSKKKKDIFNSSTLMVSGPSCSLVKSPIEVEKSNSRTNVRRAAKHKTDRSIKPEFQTQDCIVIDKSKDKLTIVGVELSNDISESCVPKFEGLKRKGDLEFEMQLEMALSSTAVDISKNSTTPKVAESPSTSSNLNFPFKRKKKIRMEDSESSLNGVSIAIGSQKMGAPLYWAEVFCSGENLTGKWVHVDAVNAIIDGEHKVEDSAAACKKTLRYAVAFAGNGAKDVTRRYCTKWYKVASQRINSTWWDTVLASLKELESVATSAVEDVEKNVLELSTRSSLEDMELETRALTEPLPMNQQAYKNHHLYVIERWLKKYEILHPKGPVLGFCSGHAVYPRICVKLLHTKERWLREGRQLKADELPAKVLKRSLKRTKEAVEDDEFADGDCERSTDLYGMWQTEPLCLPRAVNGIVPRNERGQVDVWSEKCLPPGTVHLRFPRLVPVARRLDIDFAPAMVGFEFRNGRSVPVYEGIVVCTEFKNAILEAYVEEEDRREAEENKRNEAQAVSRWYQLLSSIITRQRLNNCYGNAESSQISIDMPKSDGKNSKAVNTSTMKSEKSPGSQQVNKQEEKYDIPVFVPTENHEHEFILDNQNPGEEEGAVRVKRCRCGFSIQFEEL